MKIAAFVMTYERPVILKDTLTRIFNQSLPPEIVMVVDNSSSSDTHDMVISLFPEVVYHKVGYNSGPAGAAKLGLEKLASMGFNWIYWGDDDNPPRDHDVFRRSVDCIQNLISQNIKIGVFGGKGGNFNRLTGRIKSLSNKELLEAELLEVDTVPGGHDMFVNSQVVKQGVLPDERLFFGFEEFDFCLRVRSASYKIYVDAEKWLEEREKAGRGQLDYRWTARSFGNPQVISREFFSARNLLFIFYKKRFGGPFFIILSKMLIKIFWGFRHGWDYGLNLAAIVQLSAIHAFLSGKWGNQEI